MIHVLPLDDLAEHERSTDCPCRPEIDTEDELLVIHAAFDGRDQIEVELGGPSGIGDWIVEKDGVVMEFEEAE